MLIGGLGDLHFRATPPINRTDDYYKEQFKKAEYAFDLFLSRGCEIVLQPGDFFNAYGRDPYSLIYDVISLLKNFSGLTIYVVFGQHDLKFHNTEVKDTPLQILINAGFVHRIPEKGIALGDKTTLYGSDWNKPLPETPDYLYSKHTNILLTHRMIIKNKKLFPGQTNYTQAKKMLSYGFNLCVTGDNHAAFTYKDERGTLINCGSLCRMSIDQTQHKPMFALYDTKTKKTETFNYPIKKASEVLREKEVREVQIDKARSKDFSRTLKTKLDISTDFRKNTEAIMQKKRRIKPRTREIIEEAMNVKTG